MGSRALSGRDRPRDVHGDLCRGVQRIGTGGPGSHGPAAPPASPVLGAHPPKRTGATSARFEFSSATAGAGCACKLDARALVACHSPRVYRRLKPGRHVFRVFAEAPGASTEFATATATATAWRVLARSG